MTIDRFSLQRQPIVGLEDEVEQLERRAVPLEQVWGSLPERILYRELLRRRAVFLFHYMLAGVRGQPGAIIVDYYFLDRPLIVEEYGTGIHERGSLRDIERERRIEEIEPQRRIAVIWDTEIFNEEFLEQWLINNVDAALIGMTQLEESE